MLLGKKLQEAITLNGNCLQGSFMGINVQTASAVGYLALEVKKQRLSITPRLFRASLKIYVIMKV